MRVKLLAALSVVAIAAGISTSSARASFPGGNGRLVVSLQGCAFGTSHLATMPWRGGGLKPITPPCEGRYDEEDDETYYRSVFSPDAGPGGTSIVAYQRGFGEYGLVTLGADGSDRHFVPLPATVSPSGLPSFGPDGKHFAFASNSAPAGIWTAGVDGSDVESRVPDRCDGGCGLLYAPRWSPDGKLVAVQVSEREGPRGERSPVAPGIWLARMRDGELVRRVSKSIGTVDWSPDGRWLVYGTRYEHRDDVGGARGGNLYVVRRDGKHRRTLVHRKGLAETWPRWSPDGRWIAWVSLDFSAGDAQFAVYPSLWRIKVRGGKPRFVDNLPYPDVEEGFFSAPSISWLAKSEGGSL